MHRWRREIEALVNDRWLVFVCAMWVQSVAGVGYLFGGSMSPAIKTALRYNQRQVALLGVAKNLGDAIGFVSGALSEVSPSWVVLLVGAVQNFVGYGVVWLVVAGLLPSLPLWTLFISIFVGTNGETYYNTAALVSCIQNFPESRGPVVGILKGFSGLSGAILTQVYLMFNSSNDSSVILMVAVGPPIIVLALLFFVRPVEEGRRENRLSDNSRFLAIYGFCIVLATYLLAILLLQDLINLTQRTITIFGAILVISMAVPVLIPITSVFIFGEPCNATLVKLHEGNSDVDESEERTLIESRNERTLIESRNKRTLETDSPVEIETQNWRKRPCIGEDFTLLQALGQVDFLLIFLSLVLGTGSGITVIDNLGQICYSLGYTNTKMFVSMISIFNFLGRVGGGYFSELIMRKFALPRPLAMSVVQAMMAFGLIYYAVGWPGKIYVMTILIGMGYGAHWGIAPASVSDLFGLKSFGSLYNFQILALPIGSFVFSGVIASNIYDYYAKQQAGQTGAESLVCLGSVCYSLTCAIMSMVCVTAMVLSLTVVYKTRGFYVRLDRKSLNRDSN